MELSDAATPPGRSLAMHGEPTLRVDLLGRLQIVRTAGSGEQSVSLGPPTRRAQELFCYLLLGGRRPHHREILAQQLWGADGADCPSRGRKYLRQTLWD